MKTCTCFVVNEASCIKVTSELNKLTYNIPGPHLLNRKIWNPVSEFAGTGGGQ